LMKPPIQVGGVADPHVLGPFARLGNADAGRQGFIVIDDPADLESEIGR
jgi:hypothetical protein